MEDQVKQAKLKALRLLETMDRTEAQLRLKLKQKSYSDDVIEQAVSYVKSFGYIDDTRFAKHFVDSRKLSKSRKEIYSALLQKGVDRDAIDSAMEECYQNFDGIETIRRILEKKRYVPEEATEIEKKKLYDHLARKGFRHEDIRQVLQVSFWNA